MRGLGVDVVSLARVAKMLERWGARVTQRVLTDDERGQLPSAPTRAVEYLAGRIAAKEAASKALGVPAGIHWKCVAVERSPGCPPTLRFDGVARGRADALGVLRAWLSITHDAGVAVAVVVLE